MLRESKMIKHNTRGGCAVLTLATLAVTLRCILAREYDIGDRFCGSAEWSSCCCNYQSWTLDKDFFVGDKLVFRFVSTKSTVGEVTKADFDECAKDLLPANPIRVYELSPVMVNLTTAGPAYFATTIGSCLRQRFAITVNVPTPPSEAVPTPPSAAVPTPSSDAFPTTSSSSKSSTPATSATSPPTSHESSSHDSTAGKVTGVVLGVVAFVAKIWLVTYCVHRRKRNKKKHESGQAYPSAKESSDAPMFNGDTDNGVGDHDPKVDP